MAGSYIIDGRGVPGYNPGVAVPADAARLAFANQQEDQLHNLRNVNADLKAQGQSQVAAAQAAAAMRVEQARQQFENERAQAEQSLAVWQNQMNEALENYRLQLRQAKRQTSNPYTYGPGGV